MGDIIVVRPRSALGRRIECERIVDASGKPVEGEAELAHTEVYDLARIVSRYATETEKNLRRLFEHAEKSGHVLVFDESDELFGRRSATGAEPCVRLSPDEFAEALRRTQES